MRQNLNSFRTYANALEKGILRRENGHCGTFNPLNPPYQGDFERKCVSPIIHIPTDMLFEIAPKAAEWCRENFQYNNIFDNAAAKADLNFRYTIPFVEGVHRIVGWLEARERIHDEDEPELYSEIIERWRHFSKKETFFRETDSAKM